jgi:hypothetical protein
VVASAHLAGLNGLKMPYKPLFERYVLLDTCSVGKVKAFYDADGQELYYD